MSQGPWVAACEVVAVPVSTPAASTAVVPAASSARRARRIHGCTVMNELLHRVGGRKGSHVVSANNRGRKAAVRMSSGADTAGRRNGHHYGQAVGHRQDIAQALSVSAHISGTLCGGY